MQALWRLKPANTQPSNLSLPSKKENCLITSPEVRLEIPLELFLKISAYR